MKKLLAKSLMAKTLVAVAVLTLVQANVEAAVKTEVVTYKVGSNTFKGYLAYDDAVKGKRPGVMVVHEWWGLNDYARKRAEQLAGMGYVAFACDMYGDGKVTESPKEAGVFATALRKDVKEWEARAIASMKVLRDHPLVDAKKLASIGYCFGGSTSLQLAYSGADLAAVVSFHGAMPLLGEPQAGNIKAKILICHGAADSFVPEVALEKTRDVLEKGKVDYQMLYLGGAVHSFTSPEADKLGMMGMAYNAAADRRSWAAMKALFDESFGAAK